MGLANACYVKGLTSWDKVGNVFFKTRFTVYKQMPLKTDNKRMESKEAVNQVSSGKRALSCKSTEQLVKGYTVCPALWAAHQTGHRSCVRI